MKAFWGAFGAGVALLAFGTIAYTGAGSTYNGPQAMGSAFPEDKAMPSDQFGALLYESLLASETPLPGGAIETTTSTATTNKNGSVVSTSKALDVVNEDSSVIAHGEFYTPSKQTRLFGLVRYDDLAGSTDLYCTSIGKCFVQVSENGETGPWMLVDESADWGSDTPTARALGQTGNLVSAPGARFAYESNKDWDSFWIETPEFLTTFDFGPGGKEIAIQTSGNSDTATEIRSESAKVPAVPVPSAVIVPNGVEDYLHGSGLGRAFRP